MSKAINTVVVNVMHEPCSTDESCSTECSSARPAYHTVVPTVTLPLSQVVLEATRDSLGMIRASACYGNWCVVCCGEV